MTSDCGDCALKVFVFLLILGAIIAVTTILSASAVIFDSFVLVYFALIGWLCELKIITDCHGFSCGNVKMPLEAFNYITFFEKIKDFYKQPLICSQS